MTPVPPPSPHAPSASAPRRRVLLVGWDAADWQVINPLLDAGRMPHLRRLVEGGVMGNLQSLSPMLSPVLWTSIATGKRAYAHGVHGFVEPTPDRAGLRPVGTRSRTAKALWNILSQSGLRSVVCGWQASQPAEAVRGAMVSNAFAVPPGDARPDAWPLARHAVHPPELAAGLADLRVHPAEIEGGMIQELVPRAAELNQADPGVQRRFGCLMARLAEVLGTHAVATELLETQPWDFGAVYYECIDQVGHEFMPFHPPRLPEVPAGEFEAYRDVMANVYLFHDQMLGRLVELAGPDAHILVVSDHGFESGAHRPRGPVEPARWHRPQGIFVLHGPGVPADARVEGATLLDLAPTVLTLFGLPAGDDMAGRVLLDAFVEGALPIPPRVPSWEDIPGEDGRLPPADDEDPAVAQAVLQQFVALGYVDGPDEDTRRAVERAEAEASFNVAASLLEGGRPGEAKSRLLALTGGAPDEIRYWHTLASACFAAGTPEEAAPCLTALERLEPGRAQTVVWRGLLAWSRNDLTACAAALAEAERLAPGDALIQTYLGRLHLRLRRWPDAERAFRHALTLDPESAEANYGLSVALPRQGRERVEPGIEYALRAVGLRHEFPEAHFQLGALLSRLGWYERAVQAFEITLRLRPGYVLAHRYLARIHRHQGRKSAAQRHDEAVAQLTAMRFPQVPAD